MTLTLDTGTVYYRHHFDAIVSQQDLIDSYMVTLTLTLTQTLDTGSNVDTDTETDTDTNTDP